MLLAPFPKSPSREDILGTQSTLHDSAVQRRGIGQLEMRFPLAANDTMRSLRHLERESSFQQRGLSQTLVVQILFRRAVKRDAPAEFRCQRCRDQVRQVEHMTTLLSDNHPIQAENPQEFG